MGPSRSLAGAVKAREVKGVKVPDSEKPGPRSPRQGWFFLFLGRRLEVKMTKIDLSCKNRTRPSRGRQSPSHGSFVSLGHTESIHGGCVAR